MSSKRKSQEDNKIVEEKPKKIKNLPYTSNEILDIIAKTSDKTA